MGFIDDIESYVGLGRYRELNSLHLSVAVLRCTELALTEQPPLSPELKVLQLTVFSKVVAAISPIPHLLLTT